MTSTDLLIVGPEDRSTGGIARYIAEQQRHLKDSITVAVHDTSTPSGSGIGWMVRSLFAWMQGLLLLPFRERPDVVHVHTSHGYPFYLSTIYVLFTTFVWRTPVVLHVHGSSFDEFVTTPSLLVQLLQSITFSASDSIIVLSEYWRKTLEHSADPDKLLVLPNAVSPDDYTPRFDTDRPRLVFVSNHIERKGVVEFTEAVEELLNSTTAEFEVTIAGKGPLSDHAEQLASTHDEVEYRGYVSEAEKRRILNQGSIYLLPTYAEGLPIALLEGMAGGNAIISTDVGGIPDLVDEENGVTIPPGDTERLGDAIEKLINSPEEITQMSRANVRRIERDYSWNSIAPQLAELYLRLSADE